MDAKRLLDQFLGTGMGGSSGGFGAGHARGGLPAGGTGGLGDILGQLGGALGGQGAGARTGGAMGGLGDVLGGLQRHANANPMASGALAGGLASVLLGGRRGRGLSQSSLKLGGLALIAGLAYKAYQDSQAKAAGHPAPAPARDAEIAPPPADSGFLPSDNEAEERAQLLVTAMIAAAKADGTIDAAEQKHIFERLGALDLDADAKAYVLDQMRAPLDIDGIARQARRPEVATEVYAASLLAIDPDHPAEKAYLQMLAARLNLSDELVAEIHRAAETARAAA